jgi:hypothetical protein
MNCPDHLYRCRLNGIGPQNRVPRGVLSEEDPAELTVGEEGVVVAQVG